MFRRSRLTINAPTAPNIANAITYGTCSAIDSSFATTSTIAIAAVTRNPASASHGQRAGLSGTVAVSFSR